MISSVTKIIDKIGEIFTVFDFSYIVSGIASFSIICYGLWQNDLLGSLGSTSLNVIAAIIFTYLCGLLSFTIGKTIRATVISSIKAAAIIMFIRISPDASGWRAMASIAEPRCCWGFSSSANRRVSPGFFLSLPCSVLSSD